MEEVSGTRRAVAAGGGRMTRRELLTALGFGVGAAVVVDGCAFPPPEPDPPKPPPGVPDPLPFPDGVMAGDPATGGAVIWTRVETGGAADAPVLWTVAEDPGFTQIAAGGLVVATSARGHMVHVPIEGLLPDRWYHYRFEAAGPDGHQVASRTGRLRTSPSPGSSPGHLRFAFGSCQQLNDSWFVAHRAAAAEPGLDFFMHLGDYVYVSDTSTLTLDDYRAAYRRWRRQPMLRELHAAVPTVAVWDDGELYNGFDASGDPQRIAAGTRAWFESFPVLDAGGGSPHRRFSWGDLADLFVLDVRSRRDPNAAGDLHAGDSEADDLGRTTLGTEQYTWLADGLAASGTAWRLIGSGYNVAPWRLLNLEFLRPFRPDLPPNAGFYAPSEGWDDYMAERRQLLEHLLRQDVHDTVFASAHTHIALVAELQPDYDSPTSPVAAFDFCSPAMTADPDPRRAFLGDLPLPVAEAVLRGAEQWVLGQNRPYLRHMNLVDTGYTVVDVTPDAVEVTIRLIDTFDPDAEPFDGARFRVRRGAGRIEVLPTATRRGSFG